MFNSRDRLALRDDIRGLAQISRSVHLLIPSFVDTAYDAPTYGAINPTSGDGLGRSASWTIYEIACRFLSVSHDTKLFGRVPAAAEVGDTLFYIGLEWDFALRAAVAVPEAYLLVDEEGYRPFDIETNGTVQLEEIQVVGRKFNPPFRATGY